MRAGARWTKARRQAQAATGLRAVVAQAPGSDCGGSADGGTGFGVTGSERIWQQRECALGIRTVVAQAAAQAQGMNRAHGRGDSGSREAGRELWCRANSGHDLEVV